MAKKLVYTLNGSVPTATSAVYTEPLTITSSKKIRAATYDEATGRMSDVVTSFVRIIPSNYETQKYYCCHLMVSLGGFAQSHVSWIQSIKDQGYNLLWLHLEEFSATDDNYKDNKYLKQIMDACDVVGIPFMVGIVYGGSVEQKVKLFTDTWNRASLFKIDGKPVYTDYFLYPTLITATRNALAALGMSDFYYWSGTGFPYNAYGTSSRWIDEQGVGDGDYTLWAVAQQEGTDSVEHVYDTRPLDGIIFFCGDNYDAGHTVRTNRDINTVSHKMGKLAMGANMHFYSSSQYQDYGFSGTAQIWNDIMSVLPENRMQGVCDITANDYKESTYLAELSYSPVDGMAFIPPFNTEYTFGKDMRYPLLDHTGMQKFYRPWVDAYLANAQAPVFSEDRLFCRYMLHPANVAPRAEVPYVFYDQSFVSQHYWNTTLYANPDNFSSVAPVRNNGLNSEAIKVGAHLTSPAQLKINDTLSALMPAGPAWFEIPLGSFRGAPRFAIVRNGQEVKYGFGEQDITDDPFPGGWGLLSTEINPHNLVTPAPVTVMVDTDLRTIESTHPLGINEIEYSEGLRPWQPYTGTLHVDSFTYDAGFWRFRTKATSSRNAGIVVRTPSITGDMRHGEEGEYLIWNKHVSNGVIVDANGGWKTPAGASTSIGATAAKRLGGNGSWFQIELSKSLTDVRIFLQFSNNDDGDYNGGYYSSNIFFLDFGQFNPPGQPSGYRLDSGMIIRLEVSGNDIIVSKSYNNGVKFFGEVVIPNKLDGLTNPYIKMFTPAGNAQQMIVSTKGLGLI